MSEYMSDVDSASIEMADGNEPELIASDIEDDVLADFVHFLTELYFDLTEVDPMTLLGQAVPDIKRHSSLRVSSRKLL